MTSRVMSHVHSASASENSDSEEGLSDQEILGNNLRVSGGKDSGYRYVIFSSCTKFHQIVIFSDIDSSTKPSQPVNKREELLPAVAASYRNILKQVRQM